MVGMTQTALARVLEVTPSAVSAWEGGHKRPSDTLIPSYAEALKITRPELLDILEKP